MGETYTFVTSDNHFTFTVKTEFLKGCANPHEFRAYDLMTQYKVNQYLHNPAGPAIMRNSDKFSEFWLNGRQVSKEEGEKIAHNFKFNNKLTAELAD